MVCLGHRRDLFRGFQHLPGQHDSSISEGRQMVKLPLRRKSLYYSLVSRQEHPRLARLVRRDATSLIINHFITLKAPQNRDAFYA